MTQNLRQFGRVVVLTGATGAGKSAVLDFLLLIRRRKLIRVVTCTTRAPRNGEVEGKDYHFVERSQFDTEKVAGNIIVPCEFNGHLYGTRLADVLETLREGPDAVFTLELSGAQDIRQTFPQALVFYIGAPREVLVARTLSRGGMSMREIESRHAQEPPLTCEEAVDFDFIYVDNSREGELGRVANEIASKLKY